MFFYVFLPYNNNNKKYPTFDWVNRFWWFFIYLKVGPSCVIRFQFDPLLVTVFIFKLANILNSLKFWDIRKNLDESVLDDSSVDDYPEISENISGKSSTWTALITAALLTALAA